MVEAITLPSGHVLELGVPEFSSAKKLFKTLARELRDVDVNLENLDLKEIGGKDINVFKNVFLQVAASDAIEACVFECAAKSMLNGQKITVNTFNDVDLRQDYLLVAWEVIKLSLTPFFSSLSLRFSTPVKASSPSQQ